MLGEKRWERWWPYVALLAGVVFFYRHVLFYSGYEIPYDLKEYHFPLVWFMSQSFQRAELPLWDPYPYCGVPIFANINAQLFYPPTLLLMAVSRLAGDGNLYFLLELQLIAHIVFAGISTYWLLRRLELRVSAAVIGATVFQLGCFFASQTQHLGAVNAAAWMPMAWLSALSLQKQFTWRWLGLLTLVLALAALAGFPQVTAVVYGSTIVLAALLIITRQSAWNLLLSVSAAAAWSVLLAAVQLVPTYQLKNLSLAAMRGQWLTGSDALPVKALVTMIVPNFFGIFEFEPGKWSLAWNPTFLYLYCGLPAVIFFAVALLFRRCRYVLVFGCLALITVVAMFGINTPAGAALIASVPAGIRGALYMNFWMSAFSLSIAVVAAFGADWFLRSRGVAWQAALIILVAADLIAAGSGRFMNTTFVGEGWTIAHDNMRGQKSLPEDLRRLVNTTVPPSRIDTVQGLHDLSVAASLFEIPTAGGDDPFALNRILAVREALAERKPWERWIEVSNPSSPVLDLLNVRYLITNNPDGAVLLEKAGFRVAANLPGTKVFENEDVLPRFFLVSKVHSAADAAAAIKELHSPNFDPASTAIVEGNERAAEFPNARTDFAPVEVLEYSPRRIRLRTKGEEPAFLVSSEAAYPGWRAVVDNHEQAIIQTNVAFRGLFLSPGEHQIEMRFEPDILWQSGLVSGAALIALLGTLIVSKRPKSIR